MFTVKYHYQSHGHWKDAHKTDILNFVPYIGLKFMTTGANYEVTDVAYDPEEETFNIYLVEM